MRTSIKLYEINTAFHEAMILCFRILLTKDVDVIKKGAIYDGAWPRPTLLGDMEFFWDALWCEQNKRGPVVGWNVLPQPFYIQPAIFPQLTWGGHFTGGSLTPPISARMNHWFIVARSRKLCRKLDATKLYPTEPFSSSHLAMFKPAACDVTM